jgi:hypothetical protein
MTDTTTQNRAAADQFELVIRLQQSRSNHTSDGGAGLRLRAQALVRDILMSRLEVDPEVGAQEYVHTRGFSDLGKALAASRALQVAFEGFRNAVPSGRVNVSMVLDSSAPEEALSTQGGPSVEQKDLLNSAKPSQVLVTQAFYDRVAHYQPALRSFPLRAGVYEFLWTSEERLNELQAEAEFMPTLVIDPVAASATATVFTDQPVGTSAEAHPDEGTWRPRQERIPDPEERESAHALSRPRIIALGSATAAAVLLGIAYLVISHTSASRRPAVAAPKSTVVDPGRAATNPAAPANLPSKPPSLPAPHPPAPAATTSVSAIPSHVAPSADHNPPPLEGSKPAAKIHECSIPGEVPDYLKLAENNSSKGNYERAISEYTQVLSCEPGNRQAQEGLRNAKAAEQYNSR